MSSPRIDTLLIDEENEEKFAAHGVSARQVTEVLGNVHVVLKNRKQRRGLYLLVGKDKSGRCIAVPVEATHKKTLWRPITAWPCKQSEETLLEKRGKQDEQET
ncbi:MAG: hypothetical protein HY671_04245 [Chloroflexi bacterium]|nr:hypothetical protein [Chloroflexota bacterium]